jgi:hypothetical protein
MSFSFSCVYFLNNPLRGFYVIASMFFVKGPYVFAYYRVIQKSPYIGINLMDQQFPGYWIGLRGPQTSPPLDFYLWGLLKATVYQVKIQYMDHLKERIRDASERITSDVLTGVRHEWERHICKYYQCNGTHIEHAL